MKNQILKIGSTLSKVEQKAIKGGGDPSCFSGLFLTDLVTGECFYGFGGARFTGIVIDGCCC